MAAIPTSQILSFARSVLADDKPQKFWSDGDLRQYLNSALDFVIYETYDATEFTYLQKGTVSIVQDDVDEANQFIDLPDLTIYVSDFNRIDLERGEIDLRPSLTNGGGSSPTRLILHKNYDLTGTQIFLTEAPTQTGTITLFYKTSHPLVTENTADLEAWLPAFSMNALVMYMIEYAKLRDEANDPEINRMIRPLLQAHLDRLRGYLIGMHGKARMWRSNFNFPL